MFANSLVDGLAEQTGLSNWQHDRVEVLAERTFGACLVANPGRCEATMHLYDLAGKSHCASATDSGRTCVLYLTIQN